MNNVLGQKKFRGKKLPLSHEEYRNLRKYIRAEKRSYEERNLLLINLQTNTSLRACDVLKLKVGDVYRNDTFISAFWLEQQKTKTLKLVNLVKAVHQDLAEIQGVYERQFGADYFCNPENPLFPSRNKKNGVSFQPISY